MKAQNLIILLVVASVSLMISQFALAQGVGNLPLLPTLFQTGTPANGWTVMSSVGPIPVVLNPAGPVWGKTFTGPNGGPFSYAPTSGTNPALPVTELLQVAGNLPWTDWHEDVFGIDASGAPVPGWTWGNATLLVGGLPAPGLTVAGLGTSNLSFFFNSLASGTIVNIRKDLVYTGPAGAVFNGTLAIHEYPTPEPATMGLLSLGSLLLWRRRRTSVA